MSSSRSKSVSPLRGLVAGATGTAEERKKRGPLMPAHLLNGPPVKVEKPSTRGKMLAARRAAHQRPPEKVVEERKVVVDPGFEKLVGKFELKNPKPTTPRQFIKK